MPKDSLHYCQHCARLLQLGGVWRDLGCPVAFTATCDECQTPIFLIARLVPQFQAVPQHSRFDWHAALTEELYRAFKSAAKREADLLGNTPPAWGDLDPTERRLWFTTYRNALRRSAA